MLCPKCGSTLIEVEIKTQPQYGDGALDAQPVAGFEVDQCTACNGVWFDLNELDRYLDGKLVILNSAPVKDRRALDKRGGNCPRCEKPLAQTPAPKKADFIVDACAACNGVWLDSDEIEKLEVKNLSFKEKHLLVFQYLVGLFKKK